MKNSQLSITGSQAERLCVIMIAAGALTSLIIDGSEYLNSSWLCVIIGFVISLPALNSLEWLQQQRIIKKIWIIASVYMAFQTAATVRLLINSISYSNIMIVRPAVLTIVMLAVCVYIILRNGAGVGNALKLCGLFAFILFIIICIGNLGYMNPRWLTPVGGPGIVNIIKGSLSMAGTISTAALINVPAEKNPRQKHGILKSAAVGSILALFICLYCELLAPVQTQIELGRLQNIEMILANGRTSLGIQLPVTVLWFVVYIMAMASYAFASALFLNYVFGSIGVRLSALMCMLLAFLLASFGFAESEMLDTVNGLSYASTVVFVVVIAIGRKKLNEGLA